MKRAFAILVAVLCALSLGGGVVDAQTAYTNQSGTYQQTWAVGGATGPLLNNNSGAIEGRNSSNSAFAVLRGATPAAANDLATKNYVDTQVAGGTVTTVNGVSMPAGGGLTVGQVLQASGASSAVYAAVNVALAASITGTLPTTHGGTGLSTIGTADQLFGVNHAGSALAYFTPSGDLALASGAFTVSGLETHALPSLTPGFLQWTGSAWALSTPAQPNVTGSGFWHETAGGLDAAASRGSPAQIAITNAGGTDAGWVTISLDGSLSAAGALTVGGLKGNTLPALTTGNLNWTGSAWALTPPASVSVTGSGVWHSTAGTLDSAASRGSPGQILVTNLAGTDTPWVTVSGDETLASTGAATVTGLKGSTLPSLTTGNLNWTGSAWALTPSASVGVTGSGLWHSTSGALDGSAFRGSPGQFPVTNAGGTDTPFVSLSGDATLAASGAATLATVNGAPGTFGSGANVPVVTVNGKGLVTSVTTTPVTASLAGATGILPVANGGTGLSAAGTNGQVLTTVGGSPAWAANSTPGTVLVFQPGGVSGNAIFTSWSSLFTAAASVVGPLTVYFDGSFNGGAATIPSGTWNFANSYVKFQGPISPFSSLVTVTTANGCSISGVSEYANLEISNSSSSAVTTLATSAITLVRAFSASFDASASAPFFSVTGSGTLVLQVFYSGNVGVILPNPVISCVLPASCVIELFQLSDLGSTAITGNGHYSIQIDDTAVTNGLTAPVAQFQTKAINLGYNDSLASPTLGATQVQAAIDALKPRAFTAGLDLSGTATSQTVVGLRGNSLPAPSSGWLQWNGSAFAWTTPPGGVTPPAGSGIWHSSSGLLDVTSNKGTAGQFLLTNSGATDTAWGSISGDATASTSTVGQLTVTRVNGATVPAAGALVTGNAAHVSGASALTYSAVNLAGGSGWVTGLLPSANQASQTMAGDVTGVTSSNTVVQLSGSGGTVNVPTGVAILTPNSSSVSLNFSNATTGLLAAGPSGVLSPAFEFPENSSGSVLFQAFRTSNAATNNVQILGQAAFSGATGANRNGGSIDFTAGSAATGGVPGNIRLTTGDTNTGITLSTPSVGGPATLSFTSPASLPEITQDPPGANVSGQTLTLASQSGGSGTSNGGNLLLSSGAAAGTGQPGIVIVETGDGNTELLFTPSPQARITSTTGPAGATFTDDVGFEVDGTFNSQARKHKRYTHGGQITSNGGQIDLLFGVPTGAIATVHARAQCRISSAGTGTLVGDSIVAGGSLSWKSVGGSVSGIGGSGSLFNSYIQEDATMGGASTPLHMSPSGFAVDVTMLIAATSGTLGIADCTIWADVDFN